MADRLIDRVRRRHHQLREDRRASAGVTLIELLVAMVIFSIVAVMVTDQLNIMPIFEGRMSNAATTSDQVTSAFLVLDGEVRYAADINHPWTDASGNYWDEFESDWAAASQGSPQCTEVEYVLATGQLQQRTWLLTNTAAPAAPPGAAWRVLSTGLSTSPPTAPFALNEAGPSWATAAQQGGVAPSWQVTFTLVGTAGGAQTATSTTSQFTITAIDTPSGSRSRSVCGGAP